MNTNPILTTLKGAYRLMQSLDIPDLRGRAMDRADSMLAGYGYTRGPSLVSRVATHAVTFGAGVAVGAGVGVLLAPKAGAETRRELAEAMEDLYSRARESLGAEPSAEEPASQSANERAPSSPESMSAPAN